MKIDPFRAQQVYNSPSTLSSANNISRKGSDPIIENLKLTFYQDLSKADLSHANDILTLLDQFDVKDGGNQTLKEKRQIALLVYAHQQSELEHHENKNLINRFFRFFVQLVKNAFFCKKNPSKILLFSLHLAKILK